MIDLNFKNAKRKFILSLGMLAIGIIVYTIIPIDLISDILGPIGWIDDIFALLATTIYSVWRYIRLKKTDSDSITEDKVKMIHESSLLQIFISAPKLS